MRLVLICNYINWIVGYQSVVRIGIICIYINSIVGYQSVVRLGLMENNWDNIIKLGLSLEQGLYTQSKEKPISYIIINVRSLQVQSYKLIKSLI